MPPCLANKGIISKKAAFVKDYFSILVKSIIYDMLLLEAIKMQYTMSIVKGHFLKRPNRFIAYVEIDGQEEICHVKNTGRCKELLIPGTVVYCALASNPNRKTKYDLIAVEKNGILINMDSQAPNRVVQDWLEQGGLGEITELRAEVFHKDSRFDFSFQKNGKIAFLEVKGVTLEHHGICSFPDAPTERGRKHLNGLTRAVLDGYAAYVIFVIQMEGMNCLIPNRETDPQFAAALENAVKSGVTVIALECNVTPCSLSAKTMIPVCLSKDDIN